MSEAKRKIIRSYLERALAALDTMDDGAVEDVHKGLRFIEAEVEKRTKLSRAELQAIIQGAFTEFGGKIGSSVTGVGSPQAGYMLPVSRYTLERILECMEQDWVRIEYEWGSGEPLEKAIARESPCTLAIRELRAIIDAARGAK